MCTSKKRGQAVTGDHDPWNENKEGATSDRKRGTLELSLSKTVD